MNRRKFLQTSSGAVIGSTLLSPASGDAAVIAEKQDRKNMLGLGESILSNNPAETDPLHQQAIKRYTNWKFGMFIHWGPYSLASVEASWPIMKPSSEFAITQDEYVSLHERFNPTQFDPNAWVQLAKQTGMRYMVFTTKHHDGFCMFDTSFTDYKITNTPYKKDIVAMLAEAAKQNEMPLGLYYSPPDLHHPDYRDTSKLASTNWNGEPTRSVWPTYLHYMELQLRELLTRYGDIVLIWFDGLFDQRKYDGYRMQRVIHELQPQTLINNRVGILGDFETPEQFLPKAIPVKGKYLDFDHKDPGSQPGDVPLPQDFRLWETCMTINNTWAFNKNDHNYKSAETLIHNLVEVASKGGNFLLNVGPGPDGVIQPEFVERLQAIGKWMQVNGESIYGTTYGPLQNLPYGKTTAKENKIFLHVFDWPTKGTLEVEGLKAHVTKVETLSGMNKLTFNQTGTGLRIELPAKAPDPYVSVLQITLNG
jgi:alpha-L-fucosidase